METIVNMLVMPFFKFFSGKPKQPKSGSKLNRLALPRGGIKRERGKIKQILEMQRVCAAFGVAFEPARHYKRKSAFKLADFVGRTDRILVRTPNDRTEFVLSPKPDPERLKEIEAEIKSFVGIRNFTVQSVGKRELIAAYGEIFIRWPKEKSSKVTLHESRYRVKQKSPADAFRAYPSEEPVPLQQEALKPESVAFLTEKFQNQNIGPMVEYFLKRLSRGSGVCLKFVRYKGQAPCFYYLTGGPVAA